MKKLAIINQKGGPGKSTVSSNVAYGLALHNKKVLLCDICPQNNSGKIYTDPHDKLPTSADLFADKDVNIKSIIRNASVNGDPIKNLNIIPSATRLARVAEDIVHHVRREERLHRHLKKIEADYDFTIIDCPPNLGVLTVNAIYTANIILIPVNYDDAALDGMADLLLRVKEVKEDLTSSYQLLVLRNEIDIRNKQTVDHIENELKPFEKNLLKTRIRRTESINQARIAKEPIYLYDPRSNGVADFNNLVKELINA